MQDEYPLDDADARVRTAKRAARERENGIPEFRRTCVRRTTASTLATTGHGYMRCEEQQRLLPNVFTSAEVCREFTNQIKTQPNVRVCVY